VTMPQAMKPKATLIPNNACAGMFVSFRQLRQSG
jgi:hypothetical protein